MAARQPKTILKKQIHLRKATIVGNPPAKVQPTNRRHLNTMWNSAASNWYQYNLATSTGRAPSMSQLYQAYSMPQTYMHMPQQQYYYDASQLQPNTNTLAMTMGQPYAPAQAHAQVHPQQQTWYDYWPQQYVQNYGYWYGRQPAVAQMPTAEIPRTKPQYAHQTPGQSSQALSQSHSRLRIRNSQQELDEYQSFAARSQRNVDKTEAAQVLDMLKVKLQTKISKAQKQLQSFAVEEPLPSKDSNKTRRLFAGKGNEVDTPEQPSCSSQDKCAHKKPNFLKRLFRGTQYSGHVQPLVQQSAAATKETNEVPDKRQDLQQIKAASPK